MSASEQERWESRRPECEVAADAVWALVEAGLLAKTGETVAKSAAACGLTVDDVRLASLRWERGYYVSPSRDEAGAPVLRLVSEQHREASRATRRYRKANPAPGVRRCVRCGDTKPVSDFPLKDPAAGSRRSYCRPCWLERQRERYLSVKKQKALNAARLTFTLTEGDEIVGLSCIDCQQPFKPGQEVHGSTSLHHVSCPADYRDAR